MILLVTRKQRDEGPMDRSKSTLNVLVWLTMLLAFLSTLVESQASSPQLRTSSQQEESQFHDKELITTAYQERKDTKDREMQENTSHLSNLCFDLSCQCVDPSQSVQGRIDGWFAKHRDNVHAVYDAPRDLDVVMLGDSITNHVTFLNFSEIYDFPVHLGNT